MANHLPSPPVRQGTSEVTLLTSADPLPADVAGYDRWRTGLTWRPPSTSPPNRSRTTARPSHGPPQPDPTSRWSTRSPSGSSTGATARSTPTSFAVEGRAALEDRAGVADRPRSVDRRRPSPVAAVDRHAGVGYGIGAPHRRRSVANYQDATRGGRAVVHVPYRALESASASLLDVVTRSRQPARHGRRHHRRSRPRLSRQRWQLGAAHRRQRPRLGSVSVVG